jgi:alpha-methylacyl-CoA racemase
MDAAHLRQRESVIEREGVAQSAPAPRFSRTPSAARPERRVETVEAALARWEVAPPAPE